MNPRVDGASIKTFAKPFSFLSPSPQSFQGVMHEPNSKEKQNFGRTPFLTLPTALTVASTAHSYRAVFHGLIYKVNWHRQVAKQIQQEVIIQHWI